MTNTDLDAAVGFFTMEGGEQPEEFQLHVGTITLGRAPDCDLCLRHATVTRHHARVLADHSGCTVLDLGSANGTFLNDIELPAKEERPLSDGDVLRLGPFRLTFHAAAGETGRTTSWELAAPTLPARLRVTTPAWTREFPLLGDIVTLGRDPSNDIVIDDDVVSRRHARLERRDGTFEIIDLGSANGLHRGRERVERLLLSPGDAVGIGFVTLEFKPADRRELDDATLAEGLQPPTILAMPRDDILTIGRDADADLSLLHPVVNKEHARVVRKADAYVIEDLGSATGTFVNGSPVRAQPLVDGDVISIGPHRLSFSDGQLQAVSEQGELRVDAYHLSVTVGDDHTILHDVSLAIMPQEFVTVVGASGSGKSTLLNALCGFRPATGGAVFLNGIDLYRHFDVYRTELGYVPQDDIIHRELTVRRALEYAARLRLPRDTTPQERNRRIDDVLGELDLLGRETVPIARLSGGQRKRVSIGVELLTKPSLFFLDEATSGLDPGTEAQMMRLLRRLADGGRTVVLVTHATKNVMMCDRVVVLANGGYLAFYGPPEGALRYFEVDEFDGIYERLDAGNPVELAALFERSPQFAQNLRPSEGASPHESAPRDPAPLDPAAPKPPPQETPPARVRQPAYPEAREVPAGGGMAAVDRFIAGGAVVSAVDTPAVNPNPAGAARGPAARPASGGDGRAASEGPALSEGSGESQPTTRAGKPGLRHLAAPSWLRWPSRFSSRQGRTSSVDQFWILSRRYVEIVWRDRKTAVLLLLLAPILGALDFILWNRHVFDRTNGSATQAVTMFFMVSLITILVGTITSVREIVKEDAVYRRERMVGVRVLPYVASKVAVGALFAFYSAVVLFLFLVLAVDFSHLHPMDYVALFVPIFLGTLAGLMWGLLVSAVAPSEDRAMLLVILVLVPQFVFSGGMIPVADLGTVGRAAGYVTSTRWELGALATAAEIKTGACTAADLSDCSVPGIDKLQPAERQALLKNLDAQYGKIFNVNLLAYWVMSLVLVAVLLVITFMLQKRKDTL